MCVVKSVDGNTWELICKDKSRLLTGNIGIMVERCSLSYASLEDDCPRLPSGRHVAFEKNSLDSYQKDRLESEYCYLCPFRVPC